MIMAGPNGSKVLVTLTILALSGVLAIQNDKTSSRMSRENIVLSASAYTGPEKTSSRSHPDESWTFQRTVPAFQLESSKNVNDYDREETRIVFKDTSHDESINELTSSKHVAHIDGNNIETKAGEYYHIVPTTSESMSGEGQGAPLRVDLLSEPHQLVGAPRQRAQHSPADQQRRGRQETSRTYSMPPILQTAPPGRQANPDIQDIITGIVKLLNGNVNVAANTVRPLRPIQATRINNRGPPRISDVPPLPSDFDTPGMNPPPPPSSHPYPFEKPPAPDRPLLPPERPIRPFISGVPLPEQVVPPWSWDSSYNGNRRPSPYPPLSSLDSSFHRDKNLSTTENSQYDLKPESETPQESSTIKKDASHQETLIEDDDTKNYASNSSKDRVETTVAFDNSTIQNATKKHEPEESTKKPINHKYYTPSKENKINNEETLILGLATDVTSTHTIPHLESSVASSNSEIKVTKSSKNEEKPFSTSKGEKSPEKVTSTILKTFSTSTLNIETSSSVQVIESMSTRVVLRPTATTVKSSVDTKFGVSLEPSSTSDIEYIETTSSVSTPTDGLPTTYSKNLVTTEKNIHPTTSIFTKNTGSTERYRPRPGIVLDDTLDYTGAQGLPSQRPYIPSRHPSFGDVFDVTVSAIQGPGGSSGESVRVSLNSGGSGGDVILTSAIGGEGFVSIDGKRTYLNLFDTTERTPTPTHVQSQPPRTQPPSIIGTGLAIPQPDSPVATSRPNVPNRRQPPLYRRPTQPPVRIDTCIVGDTSTCDASQHEACATVQGVSACHCKPGYARLQHSLPCKKIVSIVVSIRVDKFYDKKVVWDRGLADKDSESYQTLAYEANRAVESAMSMTPFSDEYMGSLINNVYQGDVSQGQGGVFVNATLKLTYEPRTIRSSLAGELQRHLLGVIHRRNNNIGNSALYVDSPPGSISNLQDLDECVSSELNDCHSSSSCTNTFGGFTCTCNSGLKDPHKNDPNESGRTCLSCPSTYCNNRGTCSYQGDQMHCTCTGNYYGTQCEVDGEVLGVAIGASVAALIIIILTLVCLVMWSRKWSREQKSAGSPVYGYIQGGIPGTLPGTLARVGSVGTLASVKQGPPTNLPPYMWAHFGEHMATANLYATEPMGPTRPSSAMFGYPPMSVHGTLPPVPLPRLQAPSRPRQRPQPDPDSSDSEPQDKDRADLIPQSSGFHVPRPKSRSSLANQSGIYNDVEYDQGDVHHLSKNNIPMSTYRPYYRT